MPRARLYLVISMLLLLALPIVSCAAPPEPTPAPPAPAPPKEAPSPEHRTPAEGAPTSGPAPSHPTGTEPLEPVLSNNLKRNCQITRGDGNFDYTGLAIGQTAVNFTLKDIHGTDVRLSQLLAEKPVVIVFGSFT